MKEEQLFSKCCFTGYRPTKFPFKLSKSDPLYIEFENNLVEGILRLADMGCKTFYTGMAMGFDILAAETVMLIKKSDIYNDIKLICAIPFKNQSEDFNEYWLEKYNLILNSCDEKIILSDEYYSGCYQVRNKYMVDNCDCVLTWFDGNKGGTKNTLDYATKKGRYVLNINDSFNESFAFQTSFELL